MICTCGFCKEKVTLIVLVIIAITGATNISKKFKYMNYIGKYWRQLLTLNKVNTINLFLKVPTSTSLPTVGWLRFNSAFNIHVFLADWDNTVWHGCRYDGNALLSCIEAYNQQTESWELLEKSMTTQRCDAGLTVVHLRWLSAARFLQSLSTF